MITWPWQIALKEMAKLQDLPERFPDDYMALCRDSYVDSYVDNTFVNACDHENIQGKINETEVVASKGGFQYKPWVISGQDVGKVMVSQGPRG